MADARDIVTWALQEIGVIAAGETLPAGEALDGLAALNAVVDQLAAERLAIYTTTRTTLVLSASTQNYTVGTGGNFNVARPVFPSRVTYYVTADSPVTEIELSQLLDDGWQRLAQKGLTATRPTHFYYNPTFATATLSLWPIPTVSTLTGVLYAPQQISEFASLSTAVSLPPGYRRLLVKNLAVELAPQYEKAPSSVLIAQALDAYAVVKRANVPRTELRFDGVFGGGGTYQIESDTHN